MNEEHWNKKEIEIRNEERISIGQKLHDSVSNQILMLQYRISQLKDDIQSPYYSKIQEDLKQLRNEIRDLSHVYVLDQADSKEEQNEIDLKKEIKNILIDFTSIAPEITFNYTSFPRQKVINVDKTTNLNLTLVIKELLLNAIKHGKASEIDINLTSDDGDITLIIEDNGRGFNHEKNGLNGIGLKNIKARMKFINATFRIDSVLQMGTIIMIQLNVNESP